MHLVLIRLHQQKYKCKLHRVNHQAKGKKKTGHSSLNLKLNFPDILVILRSHSLK